LTHERKKATVLLKKKNLHLYNQQTRTTFKLLLNGIICSCLPPSFNKCLPFIESVLVGISRDYIVPIRSRVSVDTGAEAARYFICYSFF
jgi:hypothetical protein